MEQIDRRRFLTTSAAAAAALAGASGLSMSHARQPEARGAGHRGDSHRGPVMIASRNGLVSTRKAMELSRGGTSLLEALVAGVGIVEDDPADDSVGYGGLPNEEGVVQLDASVMDGRLHRAGAVGCLERVKNPAAVALEVLRKTDHVMLVGEGALRFARAMGFKEQDLLTEKSREAWLRWRANLNRNDKWLNTDQQIRSLSGPSDGDPAHTSGTVHCSGVDANGNIASVTSTSGLSWKIPGRLGDSPIVGAGMYCDNAIGAAGATGRGEAVIQVCGAFAAVELMDRGLTPNEACLEVLKRIADRTREKRLLDEQGRPTFNVTMYAVRKDGAYGSAALWKGAAYAVHDGNEARAYPSEWLFERAEAVPDPVTNR
jgi:N4-(beta-N-acetylglucosaminyl)-L-asparaginase